jgi:hypothetical protein
MRALKALVAILTVLLVVGFGALIWGIVRQASKLAEPPAEVSAPLTGTAVVNDERAPWQTLLLDQPPGTRIASVTSAGDLMLLQLFTGSAGQDERILVIDPGTGTLLGTIAVTGKP